MNDVFQPRQNASDAQSLVSEAPSRPERWLQGLAMVGIGVLCLVVTITVVSRWFGHPLIPDDVLIVRELMVGIILFPLAAVTARRAHISVTVFTEKFGPSLRLILDRLGHGIGVLFVSGLLWAGFRLFVGAWESGEYFDGDLYIPMWIGYAAYVFGLAVFLIRLLVMMVRAPGYS